MLLILDGTDFDNYTINQWLVRFQIDGDLGPPSTTYSVGGTVAGLTGSVTLQNNGGDDIIKTTNDGFTFTAQVEGSDYVVTVSSQPTGQTCTVTNGSGTNITADVTNVSVACIDDDSGKSKKTRVVYKANRRCKATMIEIAGCTIRYVPESKAYYEKKRAEGKKHNHALRCLARQLIKVIFKLLKEDRDYIMKEEVKKAA